MVGKNEDGNWQQGAAILLAKEFSETSMVTCMQRLREAGIPVSLVGLSAGLVTGAHGLSIRPDLTLDQIPASTRYGLLMLPDGKAAVSAAFADPRVHRLIEGTLKGDGVVAASPESEQMLEQAGLIRAATTGSFLWQLQDVEGFAAEMIQRLL